MRARGILFILAFVVWMPLSWPADGQHLLVGIGVAALVACLTGDFFVQEGRTKKPLRWWYLFSRYLPVFVWECIKANIDVACRIIHPELPINPGIVKVRTTLTSDTGITFLANSITLTPGTLTVDIDKEKGVLYIHWINVTEKDVARATAVIVERLEKILKKSFE